MKTSIFKTNTILFATIFLVITSLFTISCTKPENGKDGVAGTTGTANVFYSNWAPIAFTGVPLSGSIIAPKITQDVLDRGAVMVYYKDGSGIAVFVPISFNSGYAIYTLTLGNIFIQTNYGSLSNAGWRYIIIPGGVSVNGRMMQTNYSKMSYSEVCRSLNIPE